MYDAYMKNVKLYNSVGMLNYVKAHRKPILNAFGELPPSDISKAVVLKYIEEEKARGLSHATINKHVALLKVVFRFNGFKELDFYSIKKLPEQFITYGHLDFDKQKVVYSFLSSLDLRDRCIIVLLMDTGCRLNELINIEVANIDFDTRSIKLTRTKTNRVRFVYFTPSTSKLLKRLLKKENHKYLFLTRSKKQMTSSAMECLFYRIRQKFGLKHFSPHMLRHTLSTNLYNAGSDLIFIGSILGHASIQTTKRYIHTDIKSNLKLYDKAIKKRLVSKK
jgi:integrase/recombinase XerC/integrase/recombinase XerD